MRTTNLSIRRRVVVVFLVALGIFFGLAIRVAYLQFIRGDELQQSALENRMRSVPVEARRGSIYDRNGNELVTSISVDSVYAYPSQIKNPRATADKIAQVLDMDPEDVYKLITKKVAHVWIQRKVDFEKASKLKEMELEGIGFVEESRRHYPQGSLAAHVLGFTGVDNQGIVGLEKTYDEELKGKPGRIVIEYDAVGRKIPEALHGYIPPEQGNSLVLTIDQTIQYFVERELDKIVSMYRPKNAVIIVMNPKTGEILAMGNRPTFDPADKPWKNYPQSVWDFNPAVWYCYEPGSTFKIVTMSAALEEGVVEEDDEFFDPGYIKVADRIIRCHKAGGHGSQTFAEVVQNSCNPGFVEVGLKIGIEKFYKYMRDFGFGKPTGIRLSGEAQGIVIPEDKVKEINLATMAIGQSVAVTPIQLITAASAVANNGVLLKPHLVKEIKDSNGKVLKRFEPEKVHRVISEETAQRVLNLLEGVVTRGTGRNAYVDGYRTGGKTGTAQVVGKGGYVKGKYVASFVGFAPINNPEVAVLVMVSEAHTSLYYGSWVAAPIFSALVKDILHYLKIPEQPSLEKPPDPYAPWEHEELKVEVTVPNVVNFPLEDAKRVIQGAGLDFETRGEGDIVYEQVPGGGARVLSGTTVILDLRPVSGQGAGERVTVPDLAGLTIKEAGGLLERLGLRLEPVGTGVAVKQDPPPESKVNKGAVIRVEFRPPDSQHPGNQHTDSQRPQPASE